MFRIRPLNDSVPSHDRARQLWITVAGAAVILILALAWALLDARNAQPNYAPDAALTTFDGQSIRLRDLRGKVIVVNFWASWCGPCRAEAPALQTLWTELAAQGVMFLGVDQADKQEDALTYLKQYGITYPNGPANGLDKAFRIQGLPTTFVINPQGVITDSVLAAIEPKDLSSRIRAAMGK